MTKSQPSGTTLSPSKICKLLFVLLGLKFLVLGLLFFDPAARETSDGIPALVSGLFAATSQAEASTGGVAAPPAVEAILPGVDVNAARPDLPGNTPSSVSAPINRRTAPGQVLPSIDMTPAPARSANATEDTSLSLERESLARRQENLARKEQELRVLEGELSKKLEEMRMLENRMAQMMKDAEDKHNTKLKHLVDVLANMKAKQAASVLETLDPKIAVNVLAGMRGRQAGEILTHVKAEKAAQLTESLARMQMPLP